MRWGKRHQTSHVGELGYPRQDHGGNEARKSRQASRTSLHRRTQQIQHTMAKLSKKGPAAVREARNKAEPSISCAQVQLYAPKAAEERNSTFSPQLSAKALPLCILGIMQLGLKMPPTPSYLNIGFQANRKKKKKRQGFAPVELNN